MGQTEIKSLNTFNEAKEQVKILGGFPVVVLPAFPLIFTRFYAYDHTDLKRAVEEAREESPIGQFKVCK